MLIDAKFLSQWDSHGHVYGTCMTKEDSPLMYVNIPKNASSWTKPNLRDWGWEFFNYHNDKLDKTAIVILRDPIERWVSGISEFFALYHPTFILDCTETVDLIFNQVCFDDHTEKQINFLHNLESDRCIFLRCDQHLRSNFSQLLNEYGMTNHYYKYDYQHVSDNDPDRKKFKDFFSAVIKNSDYLNSVKSYFKQDYDLLNTVHWYGTR